MPSEFTGIFGFLLLVVDLWAIISVVGSRAGTGSKVIWVLLILFLPFLGFIAWFLFGPKSGRGA